MTFNVTLRFPIEQSIIEAELVPAALSMEALFCPYIRLELRLGEAEEDQSKSEIFPWHSILLSIAPATVTALNMGPCCSFSSKN